MPSWTRIFSRGRRHQRRQSSLRPTVLLILILIACVLHNRALASNFSKYVVTDSNASFFNVQRHVDSADPINQNTFQDCPRKTLAQPIDYFITIPAFYKDPEGWRRASRPFFIFESQLIEFASHYVETGNSKYAHCLVGLLSYWAERRALLAFDYEGNHGQAWYAVEWTAATAGLTYSIVRSEPSLNDQLQQLVEAWLSEVVTKQISYPGNRTSCCNNHLYWRGLEAAIVGVITDNNQLFQYGIAAYAAALKVMNPDGSLPLEMDRGKRALHYQNFSVLPLVFLAEVAAHQGYDLYNLSFDGRNIHLAVQFLLKGLDDPAVIRRYTAEEQDLSFIDRRDELNWLEPYHRRFPGPETASWLARLRPLSHTWTGGPSTLYFAGLEVARHQAIQVAGPQ